MLKYTINILFIFVSVFALAQEQDSIVTSTGEVYRQKYGLRVGVDLSKPLRSFLDDDYKGLELVGDFRISQNLYVAAELGTEDKITREDYFTFQTQGSYLKAGIDWNTYENWYGMSNIINLGARFGVSTFSQDLQEYQIYSENQYWNETGSGLRGEQFLGEYSGLSAQWIEFVLGMKVELFNNLFLGGSVRLNYLINDVSPNELDNLYIPGFNKVTDGSKIGVGYNYTLSYLIPIFKTNKPAPKKEESEEVPARKN
ncbi:DUF6048 family protein [Robertkochia solimangrovi]|uniref:DUF6048 family protein n=1 Tax=Robertkochia solimangrovi TaxID=2213046 RepID=UPI00117ED5DA|nr:DUF6048 family protein [Robertkochia solimangrovi]TRZ43773.1 hypothetical protein DMZ48_10230 [Robertkochia solimangrovi]